MSLFRKKRAKKLFEYDPKELDLELLAHLQVSLVAKLVLVNKELMERYRSLGELGQEVPNTDNAREVLVQSADHLENFTAILETELARIQGNAIA